MGEQPSGSCERMAGAECWQGFVLYARARRRMQMCLSLVELESFVRGGSRTEGKKLKRRPTTQCESGQGRRQRTVTSTRSRSPQSVGARYQAVRIEGPHRTRLCRTLSTSIMTGKGSHKTGLRCVLSPSLRSGPIRFKSKAWERRLVCEHFFYLCGPVPRRRVGMRLSRADQVL